MFQKFLKKILFLIVIIGLLILATFALIFWQGYRFWIQSPPKEAQAVAFEVEEGEGFKTIATRLEVEELVASPFWLEMYARLDGSARDVQAGEFEIDPRMSYAKLMNELVNADMEDVQITTPEGYTIDQIGEVVRNNFNISKAQWEDAVAITSPLSGHEFVVSSEKPAGVDLEGYLFPDTYRFFVNATAEDIVKTMIDHMQFEVEEIGGGWNNYSTHEVLTLASIIEREVQSPEDMAQVADIFLKRLEVGMPLQADSTVNYITGGDSPGVSIAETKIDSLYNTYMYAGLPPGPISNPGRDAIKAVLFPASNQYYYFLTTPSGEVIYSQTYQEHLDNKYKFLD